MNQKAHPLRVLSYNIHKGFSSSNRSFILTQIREAIRAVHADLVFLQEVLGHHDEHGKHIDHQAQFEFLADSIWPHYAYGKNAVYITGHHGNAILSKYPISFWENIDVSTSKYERRGILHAVIEPPWHQRKPLHALCIHLGLREADRQHQILKLCERIESHVPREDTLVIGGDFNDWMVRASRTLEKRLKLQEAFQLCHGNHARTYPSWFPTLSLDRIYFRGLETVDARCLKGKPWTTLSDHLALYAELQA